MPSSTSPCLSLRYVAVVAALATALPLFAADASATYIVFVGLDASVKHGAQACPIVDARSDRVDVIENGQPVSVSLRDVDEVKTMPEPKISSVQVEVTDVRTKPGFAGMDPAIMRDRQQMMLSILAGESQDQAVQDIKAADINIRYAEAGAGGEFPSVSPAQLEAAYAQRDAATAALDQTVNDSVRQTTTPLGTSAGGEAYDAINYSARISAPAEIEGAYAMLRLVVQDPARPDTHFSTIRFVPVPQIGPEPREVRLKIARLPVGFTVEQCDLHVFVNGREYATNLSPHRATVDENDAYRFLLLRYLGERASATLPPQIMIELVPPKLAASVPDDQRSLTVDFAIDREGRVVDLKMPAAVAAVRSELVELLRSVRFYPGLVKGIPVESGGTFALSEFIR